MNTGIRWYFDFVSPFAYLQLGYISSLLERENVELVPILFAGLLDHHGQRGPAEVPGKRAFTYQFAQWRADRLGIPMRFPPAHPFNPLAALRLCVAAEASAESVRMIFELIWKEGRLPDLENLDPVAKALGVTNLEQAIASAAVKERLHRNSRDALAEQVFGVPTLTVNGRLFWGEDASMMFEDYRSHPALFESAEMQRLGSLPVGAHRSAAR